MYMFLPEKCGATYCSQSSDFSGGRGSAVVGEELRLGKALDGETRKKNVLSREDGERRWRVIERALQRKQRTRRAGYLIVPVVEVGSALLRVRDGARFIVGQSQRSSNDSKLANCDQQDRD
jgi:hypothetical protein